MITRLVLGDKHMEKAKKIAKFAVKTVAYGTVAYASYCYLAIIVVGAFFM